jgi:hypothetical protein
MQFSATFVILNKRLPRQIAIRGDRNDVRASFFPTGESREENSRDFNYLWEATDMPPSLFCTI